VVQFTEHRCTIGPNKNDPLLTGETIGRSRSKM